MKNLLSIASVPECIGRFVRWRDWGPGKIPVFCTILSYICLTDRQFTITFTVQFVIFIAFASIHSALGYVVNDWGDRAIDRLHGKENAFEGLSTPKGLSFLFGLFFLGLCSGLPFVEKPYFALLWAAWAFFALTYSLKPIRLKERGGFGLAVSACAQWTLPVLITFAAVGNFGNMDMIVFMVASTVSGATLEIAHQRWDSVRDRKTKTKTFGARSKTQLLYRIYLIALTLDKLAIGVVIITVCLGISRLFPKLNGVIPGLPLLSIYCVLLITALCEVKKALLNRQIVDPYYLPEKNANKMLHETTLNLVTPVYLLFLMSIFQPANIFLLLGFLYWRLVMARADWKWPLKVFNAWRAK